MDNVSEPNRRTVLTAAAAGAFGLAASAAPGVAASPAQGDSAIRPFRFNASDADLADLRRRVAATRWPDKETVGDQAQGVQLAIVKNIQEHWARHDWRKLEARMMAYPHFVTGIDSLDIHFIHAKSKHQNALPMIVTHGWPGSVIEQLKIIEPLTNPIAHGGTEADASITVRVTPSSWSACRAASTRC